VLATGVALAVLAPAVGVPVAAASGTVRSVEAPSGAGAPREVFSFTDERIDESSGLAHGDGVLYTVNDSGDGPYVYAVDKQTGQTTGVTAYSSEDVADVEGLAMREETLWVGDIGDNGSDRDTIAVYRVPAEPRADREVLAPQFELSYPDGATDAETLLVHPDTGQLFVVSKSALGGTVYAAPRRLRVDRVNLLRRVGTVPGLLTDGAFLPDGSHLVLRSYGAAAVYTFPGLRLVARLPLPPQEQGEAIAVGPRQTLYVSTEGQGSAVHAVPLRRGGGAHGTTSTGEATRTAEPRSEGGGGRRVPPGADLERPRWLGYAVLAVVVGAFGWRFSRFVRRHGRRRR